MKLKKKFLKKLADKSYRWLIVFTSISLSLKLYVICTQGNNLNLGSDDLNYIKSAVVLVRKGILTFHEYNEPTVFITPGYPFFLAIMFKIWGYDFIGFQAVRIIQAILSSITIILTFSTAKDLFNKKVALIASFMVSFYFPNIITPGYFLTENLFSVLLMLLLQLSLKYSKEPKQSQFLISVLFGLL